MFRFKLFVSLLCILLVSPMPGALSQNQYSEEDKKLERQLLKVSKDIAGFMRNDQKEAAVEYAENQKLPELRAASFVQLSNIFADIGEADKQKEFLERAELAVSDKSAKHSPIKTSIFSFLALKYLELGDDKQAKKIFAKADSSFGKINKFDSATELSAALGLARAYAKSGDLSKAKQIAGVLNKAQQIHLFPQLEKLARSAKQNSHQQESKQ